MKKKLYILILFVFLFPFKSYSLIEVDIIRGNLNPLPIAVSPLYLDENSKKEFYELTEIKNIGNEISSVVENNLKSGCCFKILF